MFILFATIKIKPEYRQQFIVACQADAQGSIHHEAGCIGFDLLQNNEDPNTFHLYEAYVSQEAFDFHNTTPHFQRWHDTVKDWFTEPSQVVFTTGLFPDQTAWLAAKETLKKVIPAPNEPS